MPHLGNYGGKKPTISQKIRVLRTHKVNSQGSYPGQSESFKGSWGSRVKSQMVSGVKSMAKKMLTPMRNVNMARKAQDNKWRQEGADMMAGRERYK